MPVGSSAKMTSGRLTRARATATRCCSPPESWAGRWPSRGPMPRTPTSSSSHAPSTALPGDLERQRDVLPCGERGDQVEGLEDEPHPVPAQPGELAVVARREVGVAQEDPPAGRPVKAGQAVQEGGLPRARGAGDGRGLAGGEGDRDLVEGPHGGGPAAVQLDHLLDPDRRGGRPSAVGRGGGALGGGGGRRSQARSDVEEAADGDGRPDGADAAPRRSRPPRRWRRPPSRSCASESAATPGSAGLPRSFSTTWRPKTTAAATAEPISPWIMPSDMKGRRMNQLVAPTSFMTETSRRRAKMAIRMVFKMSTAGGDQQHHRHDDEDPLQDGDRPSARCGSGPGGRSRL